MRHRSHLYNLFRPVSPVLLLFTYKQEFLQVLANPATAPRVPSLNSDMYSGFTAKSETDGLNISVAMTILFMRQAPQFIQEFDSLVLSLKNLTVCFFFCVIM